MSTEIVFEWDSRELSVWRGGKVEEALTRALRLAGNQALRKQLEESVAHVTGRKMLNAGRTAGAMPLVFPGTKAAISDLVWRQKISGKPVPLSRFPYVDTRRLLGRGRGVVVKVNVGGAKRRLPHAFAATMKSGHVGIFQRKGKRPLPIQELWTTRISDVMQDAGAIPKVQAKVYVRLQTAFERGLAREMAKLKRKGEV